MNKCKFCKRQFGAIDLDFHTAWECTANPNSLYNQRCDKEDASELAFLSDLDRSLLGNTTPKPVKEESLDSLFYKAFAPIDKPNENATKLPVEKQGLHFACNSCKKPLKKAGAILFSPPIATEETQTNQCNKFHLCQECFELACDVLGLSYESEIEKDFAKEDFTPKVEPAPTKFKVGDTVSVACRFGETGVIRCIGSNTNYLNRYGIQFDNIKFLLYYNESELAHVQPGAKKFSWWRPTK